MLAVLVPILRRDGELDLSDDEADLLMAMTAATIDRRLAVERAKMLPRGRSHTKLRLGKRHVRAPRASV